EARADLALPRLAAELSADLGTDRVGVLELADTWVPEERGPLAPYGLPARPSLASLQKASPARRMTGAPEPLRMLLEPRPLARADRDGIYGVVRALEEAEKRGVRLIVGSELTVSAGESGPPWTTVTLLVGDSAGYTNLCCVLTESHARHPKGKPRRDAEGLPK